MTYVKRTVKDLLKINTIEKVIEFIKTLSLHVENKVMIPEEKLKSLVEKYYQKEPVCYSQNMEKEIMKVMSWIDCLKFLQEHFKEKTNALNVKLCFEYKTPDNKWIDVVALDDNRVTILEFKSGANDDAKTLLEHEEQLDEYCSKMSHANVKVWGRFENGLIVRGFLVYTNEKMKATIARKPFVKVCDEFDDVTSSFRGQMDDSTESEIMKFESELDSSTLGAFVNVINGKVLDNVYVPDFCKDRCTEIIEESINSSQPRINIVFVAGTPGAGKTGVALALVSEYMKKQREGVSSLRIKYATGNENLYSLFTQAIKNEKTKGTTDFVFSRIRDLYNVDALINNPKDVHAYTPKTNEDIIVIDEAQRMWSSEKIAFQYKTKLINGKYVNNYKYNDKEKKVVLENDLSEPLMVLQDIYKAALDNSSPKTIIFLVGNGQEIYTGEELGEEQIINAVKRVSHMYQKKVTTKIFSSKKYESMDEEMQEKSKENESLYLQNEKRNKLSKESGLLVNALFDNSIVTSSKGIAFFVTGDKEQLNDRYLAIKKMNNKAKQRLLVTSYDRNDLDNYLDKTKMAIKNDQLYGFFKGSLGDRLEYFATEFNAQGLEVDYAYFIWGDRVKRRGSEWIINTKNAGRVFYYYKAIKDFRHKNPDINMKEHDIDVEISKLIVNAYRVLLTRAQNKTIIYVKDKETRDYLRSLLCGI